MFGILWLSSHRPNIGLCFWTVVRYPLNSENILLISNSWIPKAYNTTAGERLWGNVPAHFAEHSQKVFVGWVSAQSKYYSSIRTTFKIILF